MNLSELEFSVHLGRQRTGWALVATLTASVGGAPEPQPGCDPSWRMSNCHKLFTLAPVV